jgi:A/G-specific adenine glycosylase
VDAAERLLEWYERNRRDLPWRTEPRDPYLVLVSETMLQQTQVDRVVPLFERFIARFPSFEELAAAGEDRVVEAWSGLGYYRRARALHRLARTVVGAGGALPRDPQQLITLPGIGPYTAAAVASIAFGVREPVLDGNVLRVGARALAETADPRSAAARSRILSWVDGLLADRPPGRVNEALMELGATVCRPRSPACATCPLAASCRAWARGLQEQLPPVRRRRRTEEQQWVAACGVAEDGSWLLSKVVEGPILSGLWLPPFRQLDGEDPVEAALRLLPVPGTEGRICPTVRHSITHRRVRITPVHVPLQEAQLAMRPEAHKGWLWGDPRTPRVPTSSLLDKLRRSVEDPSRTLPFPAS